MSRISKITILIIFLLIIGTLFGSVVTELDFSQRELMQSEIDSIYVSFYIDKIENIVGNFESPDSVFKKDFTSLTNEERVFIIENWIEFVQCRERLMGIIEKHKWQVYTTAKPYSKEKIIYLSEIIAIDSLSFRTIEALDNNILLRRFLNEARGKSKIEAESYFKIKQSLTGEKSLLHIMNYYTIEDLKTLIASYYSEENFLSNYVWKNLGVAEELVKSEIEKENLLEATEMKLLKSWYAFEKWVALAATGIDFSNRPQKFVTRDKVENIRKELLPGDILLKRSNWQVTNFGITGFWTHSGLYIGSIRELDEYFADIKTENGLSLTKYLEEYYPKVYNSLSKEPIQDGNNIIEGIAAGVVINRLENIAAVDYFAALRPRLSKKEKMIAIIRALGFIDRPYDYRFDLVTDNEMICSEVIYKSYLNGAGMKGLTLDLTEKNLRLSFTPNDFAKKFDNEFDSETRELDLVIFYDASEKSRESFLSSEKEFRKSWTRPFLDIFRE